MKFLRKNKYLITALIMIIMLITLIFIKKGLLNNQYDEPEEITLEKESIEEEETIKLCTVDIKGEVNLPNVYTTECNKKIKDIIDLAKGLTDNADTSKLNLAKTIYDEMVIIVYSKEEIQNEEYYDNDTSLNETTINNDESANNNLININTASLSELKTIPGIGDAKANAIITYRTTNGPFKNISEITNVKGIGQKLYEQIKVYLTT